MGEVEMIGDLWAIIKGTALGIVVLMALIVVLAFTVKFAILVFKLVGL
jgi:hypothetical protein